MAKLTLLQPPFPNRKEYPFVATVRYKGLVIDVENLDGSTRTGKDPNGKTWSTKFKGAHYGEIRGSKGTDGDLLDVYIKDPPDSKATKAYIIHQNHPGTHPTKAGKYDEDKVILGVSSVEEAKKLYLRHYDRKDFLRSVTEMDLPTFKTNAFGENKGEKVAMDIQKLAKEIVCKTPGEKIKSKGKGRGLARGGGKGPIGVPVHKKGKDKIAQELEEMYKLGYKIGAKQAQDYYTGGEELKVPKATAARLMTHGQKQTPLSELPGAKKPAVAAAPAKMEKKPRVM